MAERHRQFELLAQIVVTVDPDRHLDEEDFSAGRLVARLEEDREALTAELSRAFDPLQGALVPGEVQIREGSVHIIVDILGAALAAGVWQLLEYLGREMAGRVRRFLWKRYGIGQPVSAVVVPIAVLPTVAGAAGQGEGIDLLQKYLVASNVLLLAWAIAVSLILLLHVL